jgi:hypothetical protein
MIDRFSWHFVTVVCGLALAGCTGSGSGASNTDTRKEPTPASVPSGLEAAHKAYLDGDFVAMTSLVRDVLVDASSSRLVKENAYELLEKAYEAQGGRLPSAFKLPEPFQGGMQYANVRATGPNGPSYSVFVRGPVHDASRIKGLTVTKLPNEIILDKQSGKGRFQIKHDTPGFEDFNLDSGRIDALPGDGVFTVHIELDDGQVIENWFIVHALAASASPELRSPVSAQSFSDPHPEIRWVPFRSPESRPFEKRNLGIYVSNETLDTVAWDFWVGEPGELGSVRIGDHAGADKTALGPGDYWMMLGTSEERMFGALRLIRGGRATTSFHVVR